MSAFTCAACGGFKYNQTPVTRGGPNDLICEDCFENGAMDAPGAVPMPRAKPGLHEVLVAIHKAEFTYSGNFKEWLDANGGEARTAMEIQKHMLGIWREYYLRVIGEPW